MEFSVIVPIYKVEAYLPRCVDSILAQSFPDFEVILVDDGSPDRCGELCDQYRARDPRVRVIHKENGGLVSARQAGMSVASGDYIVHVDGDDWVAPDLLERAHRAVRAHDPDVVSFPSVSTDGDAPGHRIEEPIPEGVYDRQRICQEILPRALMAPDMGHMCYYQWGKVFRRALVLPFQMAVDRRISLGEDVTCLMPTYLAAERVVICGGPPVYFYRVRFDSDSRAFRPAQYQQLILGLESLGRLEGGAEFCGQIDRYASFICFGMMAAQRSSPRLAPQTIAAMNSPELRPRLAAARFRGVTLKMRVTYFFFRRNWLKLAFVFLRMCGKIKGR
jgi:glycosyltransferase involved in cell wall biosynthesis